MVALVEFRMAFYGPKEETVPKPVFINPALVGLVTAERMTPGEERCQLLLIQNPMGVPYIVVEGTMPEVANKLAAGDEIVAIGGDREALEGKEPGDIAEREEAPRKADTADSTFKPAVQEGALPPTAPAETKGVPGTAGTKGPPPKDVAVTSKGGVE